MERFELCDMSPEMPETDMGDMLLSEATLFSLVEGGVLSPEAERLLLTSLDAIRRKIYSMNCTVRDQGK